MFKISVIILTYNRANLLKEGISSVLKQTYQNFELIIVDDGSLDNTEKIVKGFKDQRIVYLKHEKNRGVAASCNTGVKKTIGDYVIILNDDDLIFPFGYRQSLKIFDSAVKKSNAKCEPDNGKPSWKDLRSGMACHLFSQGWHSDDINLRLGHTISSRELDVYLNYMAQNKNRAKKILYNNNLEDVKNDLEEVRQREKLYSNRLERQKEDIEQQKMKILKLENAMKDKVKFDDIAQNLFENKEVQKALLQVMLKKGFGKQLMELVAK